MLLYMYNLPPWLCMKKKYIMMSMLIQGLKQPENDIDTYLKLLVDELQTLWKDEGVKVYDAYEKKKISISVQCCFAPCMTIQHLVMMAVKMSHLRPHLNSI